MRTALIVTLALEAVAVLLVSFGIYSRGMRGQHYWLSLTGLVEAWFIFDYCFYGTAVSVQIVGQARGLRGSRGPAACSTGAR